MVEADKTWNISHWGQKPDRTWYASQLASIWNRQAPNQAVTWLPGPSLNPQTNDSINIAFKHPNCHIKVWWPPRFLSLGGIYSCDWKGKPWEAHSTDFSQYSSISAFIRQLEQWWYIIFTSLVGEWESLSPSS